MASSNIFITPSTSLVLIKRFDRPTNIYLSSYNVPDFQVNVRDTTGSSNVQINISTIGGAKFADNTNFYSITQPYGFVNMSLRTSTFWQILHTSGQQPSSSAANVTTTRLSTSYFSLMSTATKRVSTLNIQNLDTPNSIQLVGPFVIGNLSTPGFILLKSTLNVYGNTTFDRSVFVSGATSTLSSLVVETLFPFSSILTIRSSLGVGGNINVRGPVFVQSTLHTFSTIELTTLQVQRSTSAISFEVLGDLRAYSNISVATSLTVGDQLAVFGELRVGKEVSSLGGSLTITRALLPNGATYLFDTLSTQSYTYFKDSLVTQSSLSVQFSTSAFSTVNVTSNVSTNRFITNYLSTSASISTAGDFTVSSILTVKGTLSSANIRVQNILSIGKDLTSSVFISTGTAFISSFQGHAFNLGPLFISSFGAIGGSVSTLGSTFITRSTLVEGNLSASNITVSTAYFSQNMGIASDLRVGQQMKIDGDATINTIFANSYSLIRLIISASSPTIALRGSTILGDLTNQGSSKIVSDLVRFSYASNVDYNADYLVETETLYSKGFQSYYLSPDTLYTDAILDNSNLLVPRTSFPKMEIQQNSLFTNGFSSLFVNVSTINADAIVGSFVGDGYNVSNVTLAYSTLSAAIVLASTLTTDILSTSAMFIYNADLDSNRSLITSTGTVESALFFTTPFLVLAEGIKVPSVTTINPALVNGPQFMQPINSHTLNLTNTVYLDASNRRVGVRTSTPEYDMHISGSLYYSGTLTFSTQNALSFSTIQPTLFFSTIYFSSAYVQDTLILPNNPTFNTFNELVIDSNYSEISFSNRLYIKEQYIPQDLGIVAPNLSLQNGIFTSPTYSTVDINFGLFVYRTSVGIRTISINNDGAGIPAPVTDFDMQVNADISVSSLLVSSLIFTNNAITTSLETPTFAINPSFFSTFNTLSSFTSGSNFSNILSVNNALEFMKTSTLTGSLHIRKPLDFEYNPKSFCVYSDAYISSVLLTDLQAENISYETQLL